MPVSHILQICLGLSDMDMRVHGRLATKHRLWVGGQATKPEQSRSLCLKLPSEPVPPIATTRRVCQVDSLMPSGTLTEGVEDGTALCGEGSGGEVSFVDVVGSGGEVSSFMWWGVVGR